MTEQQEDDRFAQPAPAAPGYGANGGYGPPGGATAGPPGGYYGPPGGYAPGGYYGPPGGYAPAATRAPAVRCRRQRGTGDGARTAAGKGWTSTSGPRPRRRWRQALFVLCLVTGAIRALIALYRLSQPEATGPHMGHDIEQLYRKHGFQATGVSCPRNVSRRSGHQAQCAGTLNGLPVQFTVVFGHDGAFDVTVAPGS